MSEAPYSPVACSTHDRFEHAAVRRATVRVVWEGAEGPTETVGLIEDVSASGGAEYMLLSGGERIRLDWIRSFDEVG